MSGKSSLAEQLRSIQQADRTIGGISTTNKSYTASYLFDEKEAADLDTSTIWAIAKEGLEELKAVEPAFGKFEILLFGEKTKDLHRSQLTFNQNEALNSSIRSFLRLLSPFFMMKAAHKCLEWLIRKFRVNELNIDAVMDCIFPYHETVQFIRMVQIFYFKDNDKWSFLYEVKKEARVISRTFLARRCLADKSILEGIYETVEWMVLKHRDLNYRKPATYLSFFTMLLLEYISILPKVDLEHVLFIFPIALKLVKFKRLPECNLSAYMIILALAERYPIMSAESLNDFIEWAARTCTDPIAPQLLLCVARLADLSHETLSFIAPKPFYLLTKIPGFTTILREVCQKYHLPHFPTILQRSFKAHEASQLNSTSNSAVDVIEMQVDEEISINA